MKKLILPLIFALMLTTFIAVIPTDADYAIYDDTVRLHILANSDSEDDQSLKLTVRDAILSEYSEELSVFDDIEAAKAMLSGRLSEIEEYAENIIRKNGYAYEVNAYLGEEWYDTREYDSFTLPAGYYTSLRIIIGKGDGKNWWCVMFPPMCLDACTEAAQYSQNEEILIKKRFNVRFKLVELISELTK